MKRNRTVSGLGLVCTAAGLLITAGCNPYQEGGSGISTDTFSYVSTSESPKTVLLKDSRSKEVLWTVEVPVGQKLVVSFHNGVYTESPAFPDRMRWDLIPADQEYGELHNEMGVPTSRVLEVELREPGEFPHNAKKRKASGAAQPGAKSTAGVGGM
jgi:hypothetical protein